MNKMPNLSKNEEYRALSKQLEQVSHALYKEKQLAEHLKQYIDNFIPYNECLEEQARDLKQKNAQMIEQMKPFGEHPIPNSAFSWTFRDGFLTIYGSGAMGDWLPWWVTYRYKIWLVTIISGITSIGAHAFTECGILEHVELPDSIEKIGYAAFRDCNSMYDIIFPDGLKVIDVEAFSGCMALPSVKLPEGFQELGERAFFNCKSLKTITLPEGVQTVSAMAFRLCSRLCTVTLPETIKVIQERAFKSTALTDVYYAGSRKEWDAIKIDKGNEELLSAKLHCAKGE